MKNRNKERRMTVDEVLWSVAVVMDKVGIEEEKIYAFVKSGILLAEHNQDMFDESDIVAWHDAIHEYREYMEAL